MRLFKNFFDYESHIQKRNRKVERKQKSSIILFLRNKNPVNTIYSMFFAEELMLSNCGAGEDS